MTSLAAPPCDRVAPPTGLPACQWRRRPSSSPRPATRISIGRSTARRSSPIRSRSARYCTAMVNQTRSSPPGLVSDDPSIGDYEKRKRQLRDRLAHGESEALAIFAADKISKVRELALLPPWRLCETTTRAKLTHYQASLEMLRRVAGDLALVDRLDAELNRLVSPAITRTHSARAITTAAHSKRSNQRGRTI